MDVLNEVKKMLFEKFVAFEYHGMATGEHCFYKNFDEKQLSIVIKIKLAPDRKTVIECIMKKTKERLKRGIELQDTNIIFGWQRVIERKVYCLERLAEEASRCLYCDLPMIPRAGRNSQTNARFVSFYCPRCQRRKNTKYGTGLKTELHQFLK